MAKISVYIPDELKLRMDRAPSLNWSGIAQRAFELEMEATQLKGDTMDDVIERLRASKQKNEEIQRPEWSKMGEDWAKADAEFESIAAVGDIDLEVYDYADNADSLFKELYVAMNDAHPDRADLQEFCEFFNDQRGKVPTLAQLKWFIGGVQNVWSSVKDKI